MCKLFALSSTARMSREQLSSTVDFVHRLYSKTQRDGFGLALQSGHRHGARHIERYANPKAFGGLGATPPPDARLNTPATFEVAGGVRAGGALIVHGRTSTGQVSLTNTHPFSKAGWTLAHNGVVDWHGAKHPLVTTCDSEHLLNLYAHGAGAAGLPEVSGWAAWLALTPKGRLVAGRDAVTPLHLAYVKRWRCYVLATREEDLRAYLKSMDVKSIIIGLPDNHEARFSRDGSLYSLQPHAGLRPAAQRLYSLGAVALDRKNDYWFTPSEAQVRSDSHTVREPSVAEVAAAERLAEQAEAREELRAEQSGSDTQWQRVRDWEATHFHGEGAP